MKIALTLLVASAALAGAVGDPAWSAGRSPGGAGTVAIAASLDDGSAALAPILVSDDDDDGEGWWSGEDDDEAGACGDDHREEDDDDRDEGDDDACGSALDAAPAGSVAPPQNGLFGDGAAPQAQVN